jgi:hypothetical protein
MIVVLVLLISCGIGYLVYKGSQPDWVQPSEPPPTEEELLQARLDLHRIERATDVTLAREEAHRHGQRTKEAIAEALEDGR